MLLKIELLDSKYNLRASMIQLLGGNWFDLLSKTFFTDFRPDMLSILGNILIISKLTSLQSDVKLLLLFKLSIIVTSQMYLGLYIQYSKLRNRGNFQQKLYINVYI